MPNKKGEYEMKNTITVREEEIQDWDDIMHQKMADWLNDYISDKTGYCHKGFIFNIQITDIIFDKEE